MHLYKTENFQRNFTVIILQSVNCELNLEKNGKRVERKDGHFRNINVFGNIWLMKLYLDNHKQVK